MSKIYAFDLDETLCYRPENVEHLGPLKYGTCLPYDDMIDRVNKLYDEGNTILIYTARGMAQFNGDVHRIYNELYNVTKESLKKWNIKHHSLIMGKPHYDFLIDDKALSIEDFKNKL
mgnify:FL=1